MQEVFIGSKLYISPISEILIPNNRRRTMSRLFLPYSTERASMIAQCVAYLRANLERHVVVGGSNLSVDTTRLMMRASRLTELET